MQLVNDNTRRKPCRLCRLHDLGIPVQAAERFDASFAKEGTQSELVRTFLSGTVRLLLGGELLV